LIISSKKIYNLLMTDAPRKLRVEFRRGPGLLSGPSVLAGLRSFVVTTLFEIGRSADDAEKLWTTATTDPGPEGDAARALIEQATKIQITIEVTG
jgi:hypothetical protein